MRVLFVGAIYFAEYSLYQESLFNPDIDVRFCCGGVAMPDAIAAVYASEVGCRDDIDRIKKQFMPDITIFRNWCETEKWVREDELLWVQETNATDENGRKLKEIPIPEGIELTAYPSKVRAEKENAFWFPYCVSRHWGRKNVPKDIPIMVATNIPPIGKHVGAHLKLKSINILLKKIAEHSPDLIHAFEGFHGGLSNIPYLKRCIRPSFSPFQVTTQISRAKIYISPTTIWYDEGYVSYKTVEAMACGTCVITNNYVGMEDMFGKDGENLLYANSQEESFDKIRYYLEHGCEREELARRGYEFVHNERGWGRHLSRIVSGMRSQNV